MYVTLITLHAVTASVALLAGPFARRGRSWFAAFYWSMVLMLVFLVLAVASDWRGRELGTHVIVGALIILGGVMVARAEQARRARPDLGPRFVRAVGFTLVGLVDAFVVVLVLNAGVPGWHTATVGGGIAVLGHLAIKRWEASPIPSSHAPGPSTTLTP